MAGRFEVTTVIDRPIDQVWDFLADGENDPKFSARVLEIAKEPAGPTAVGTVFKSTVKDGGVKTKREIEITTFEAPAKLRWAERSKNPVVAVEGGYDLEAQGESTKVTLYNVLEGRGFGKLITGIALSSARKGADDFGKAIKAAVEAS